LQVPSALSGDEQGIQEAPQLASSVLDTQLPLQSCFPSGHLPSQARLFWMHAPAHSFVPAGQELPHIFPSHVAEPPIGAAQAEHDVPHVAMSLSLEQASPHR
jgi:hypothetical protein